MEIVYLAGMPRSGSTLLCNILSMYPSVEATPSSPLCNIVNGMRRQWSDDTFVLAQLDDDPDGMHDRLLAATRGFMVGFHSKTSADIIVDKNRGWLGSAETLRMISPNFKMIVCLRDLRDIYASIEKRHRETLMLEFPDHMEHNLVDTRAAQLLAENGVVGSIWRSLYNLGDIPGIMQHVYVWRYEDFLLDPYATMSSLATWLNVGGSTISLESINQSTHESDSHYRLKYPHKIKPSIAPPAYSSNPAVIEKYNLSNTSELFSPRILNVITETFGDFYRAYYPEVIGETLAQPCETPVDAVGITENAVANDIPPVFPDGVANENVPAEGEVDFVELADSIADGVAKETANDIPPENEL